MSDFNRVDFVASELKRDSGAKRITAIENCVTAGKALVKAGEKVTPATVAAMVSELGLKTPSKQTFYNNKEFYAPLIEALSDCVAGVVNARPKSLGNDEDDIMKALQSARLKSMFSDIINEKNRLAGENRRLGNFIKQIKGTDVMSHQPTASTEMAAIENKTALPADAKSAIIRFMEVMENEGFDFTEDDIEFGGNPLNVTGFVELINSLMDDA